MRIEPITQSSAGASNFEVLRGAGGAACLKVRIPTGRRVKAESDALVAMDGACRLESRLDGGILSGLARSMLTNESFFLQTVSADGGPGEAVFAASDLGDIAIVDVRATPLMLASGAFLASDDTVDVESAMHRSFGTAAFSGSGLVVMRATGSGSLALSSFGSIHRVNVPAGELLAVDNGHLVAWTDGMRYDMALGAQGGGLFSRLLSSATSGEGLMVHFTGPGHVLLQTHKPPPTTSDGKPARGSGGNAGGLIICCIFVVFFMCFIGVAIAAVVMNANDDNDGSKQNMRLGRRGEF